MGFISSNKPRLKRTRKSLPSPLSEVVHTKRVKVVEPPRPRSLIDLPVEILHHIFIYNGEPSLPECSKVFYHIFGGTAFLYREVLRHQIAIVSKQPALPVSICSRRFVTAKLLKAFDIQYFFDGDVPKTPSKVFLPHALETGDLSGDRFNVLLYLLEHNCVPVSPSTLMLAVVKLADPAKVKALVNVGVSFDYQSVVAASESGVPEVLATLLDQEEVDFDDPELWKHIHQTNNASLFDELMERGAMPSLISGSA